MSLEDGISRDPFQLERLAEELETREFSKIVPNSDNERDTHDLPIYIPLSHQNPFLTAETFNVEEFLLSRTYTSLPELRSELRDYLSTLKEELVKLINDDYEAFISLSTDLRGEGARLGRLKYPLNDLKAQILESKQELQLVQSAIQEKLENRSILREEKALLHLLLKISESVTRLESLLLIAPIPNESGSSEIGDLKMPSHLKTEEDEGSEDRKRGNRAKHLVRVATEYTQLLYHVSKARADKCVFVDEIQWRIDRIQSTLSSDLDHLFTSTLLALTEHKGEVKLTETEKAKLMADLTECFRTYDTLRLWRDAEDVLRREIMRGFVKKTIFPGALAAPRSPIVPHTPFPGSTINTDHQQPPRTPYTPFSAFATKQNPFEANFNSSSTLPSPLVHLLDDSDDPLAGLYNQILRFIERDLFRIMEIAEKVSVKTVFHSKVDKGVQLPLAKDISKVPSDQGFNIMANVIWAELGRAIMDELGSAVFASGQPSEFRRHYETTQAFIRSLEFFAPSVESIEAMRSHPMYLAFEKRWQLPVYFQLRWKEIVSRLEETLATTRIDPTNSLSPFATMQAVAVWEAITSCWSAEIYIPELGHRFWKLTLQFLSRYKTWLDRNLPELSSKTAAVAALAPEKNPGSPSQLSRSTTPVPAGDSSLAESSSVDEALLKQCAATIVDIQVMRTQVLSMWREEISMMLLQISDTNGGTILETEDVLRQSLAALSTFISPLSNQITMILTKRCCDALLPVRSIPSQFRAMSNKREPTEPSYFVSSVLRPVKVFFAVGSSDGPGVSLKDEYLGSFASDIFESASQRYVYYLRAMKKTEESLRRLKKGKKSTFSLFSPSTSVKDDEGRDEERIQAQMILDVEAFGKDAETLGVNPDSSETFKALRDMVHVSLVEEIS